MGDNLPLIPERGDLICADVRPVLREVFRHECLPPLANGAKDDVEGIFGHHEWMDNVSSEFQDLYNREKDLRYKYANRLSREPLPNIYRMYPPDTRSNAEESWSVDRRDLKPSVEQDAGRDARLWIKNVLNKSSGNVSKQSYEPQMQSKTELLLQDNITMQSYSIGEAVSRPPRPPCKLDPQPPLPEYIVCVPPKIEFINFTVGNVHTEVIRLINVSKFELRLSVTPPKRRELDVELCSRLVVTSGSAAEFRIHYRPVDVRAVADVLQVRVSAGRALTVPIACYMQPPVLEILVQNLKSDRLESMSRADVTHDVLDLGSRLLGDVHRASLLFYCTAKHVSFFLLSEDAWLNFCVNVAAGSGACQSAGVASDGIWMSPVRWRGGGGCGGGPGARALAAARAVRPGLLTAALRVLCSTAVVRTLHVVADALLFSPRHITLQAHDKDYDILSEEDAACEYYVRLGTAFPGRPLAATVHIVNHSPLTYAYYWSVRPWGVCSCWTGSESSLLDEELCDEAKMYQNHKRTGGISNEDAKAVRVESAQGRLFPRSETQLRVCVPDVTHTLGVHRAVLMLVLREIPKESFPTNYDPMIVKTYVIDEEEIPGVCSSWAREVCDIVCCQLEVWWEVVPVRFVLDPPILRLTHSRRIKSTDICLKATLLYGVSGVKAKWNVSGAEAIDLPPAESVATNFNLEMRQLPNHFPDIDVIQLNAESKEWKCSSVIQRNYDTRHPSLRPAVRWLGLVPPGAKVHTELVVRNDTHQHICWWATCVRWWGERRVADVCASRAPCPQCHDRSCSCAMLSPTRGSLAPGQKVTLKYKVIAPDVDGVVATLVQVHRTSADVSLVHTVAGTAARATLLAYRVLAPVVVMRVMPCLGDKHEHCKVCSLDVKVGKNCAVLRPSFALTVGFRSCYRIKCSNLTPLPTTVKWQKSLVDEDSLKVIFIPNDFDLNAYGSIEIQVVLEPRKVTSRRIYRVHADVTHAYKPIHLLIDAAVSGLEVMIDIPLGESEKSDSFVTIKMLEKENPNEKKNLTPIKIFENEDYRRKVRKENICHCRYKMVYIPPVEEKSPPGLEEENHTIDFINEPPPFTRVCPCDHNTKPVLPELSEPLCLQFKDIPLKTVRSRVITVRNITPLFAKISTTVRRWPRVHKRTLNSDKWASDVQAPGVILQCEASRHALAPCGQVDVTVSVYADCWGLYHDQVLIQIEKLEPIVLDVWIEAVGTPLRMALQSSRAHDTDTPILWMSPSDPERTLLVSNASRSRLEVHSYVITENQYPQDELPFRLYIRFYDVPPPICTCVTALNCESYDGEDTDKEDSSAYQDMDTMIELYLARDYGVQDDSYYKIESRESTISPHSKATPCVTLSTDAFPTPPSIILMRILPIDNHGPGWYRKEPPPIKVRVLAITRNPQLLVLPTELLVKICALDLPAKDVLRVRKRLRILNTGSGSLQAYAVTEDPWIIRFSQEQCGAKCIGSGPGSKDLNLELLPRSSTEVVAEVMIITEKTWPKPDEKYENRKISRTDLRFFNNQDIFLMSTPLHLDIEFPRLQTAPNKIDFGYVMDGDYRKTYFTVMQSSHEVTIEVKVDCNGAKEYRIWPPRLTLAPRCPERVYVQYIARWQSSPAEGEVCVRATGDAGAWCACAVPLRARPALDRATHLPAHDYTDDTHLSTH